MENLINKVIVGALAVSLLFILLANIVVPYWNTTAGLNVVSTGLSASAWQGIMLILGIVFVFGTAIALLYAFIQKGRFRS